MSNMFSRMSDKVIRYFVGYLIRHFEYPMSSAWGLGAFKHDYDLSMIGRWHETLLESRLNLPTLFDAGQNV